MDLDIFLEQWEHDTSLYVVDPVEGFRIRNIAVCAEHEDAFERQAQRMEMAKAAPALVRILVLNEWCDEDTCAECGGRKWIDGQPPRHDDACSVDHALNALGLGHKERVELRRRLGQRS